MKGYGGRDQENTKRYNNSDNGDLLSEVRLRVNFKKTSYEKRISNHSSEIKESDKLIQNNIRRVYKEN